jgi:hypothetical protein
MDPNSKAALEDFVHAMEAASSVIRKQQPDVIVAPMFGAVPFIDALNIVDDYFPNEKVIYVPASNKVNKVTDVLRGTFENVIRQHTPNGGLFLSIDEVVSGNSLTRVFKQFSAARMEYANKKTATQYGDRADFTKEHVRAFRDALVNDTHYRSVGIVDSRKTRADAPKNDTYCQLVSDGTVIPIDTLCIITMDRQDFFPARYKEARDIRGRKTYLPIVEGFHVTTPYMDFLRDVADILGKPRSRAQPSNMQKIMDSYENVPSHLLVP